MDILSATIDEAYNAILNRSDHFVKAEKLLHMVVSSIRPLTLHKMNIALIIKLGVNHIKIQTVPEKLLFNAKMINLCGLFVSVIERKIRLIHQTAKESWYATRIRVVLQTILWWERDNVCIRWQQQNLTTFLQIYASPIFSLQNLRKIP